MSLPPRQEEVLLVGSIQDLTYSQGIPWSVPSISWSVSPGEAPKLWWAEQCSVKAEKVAYKTMCRVTKPLMQRLWMGKNHLIASQHVTKPWINRISHELSWYLHWSSRFWCLLQGLKLKQLEPCSQMLERGTGKSSNFHLSDPLETSWKQSQLPYFWFPTFASKALRKCPKVCVQCPKSHGLSLEAWNLCCPPCPKAGLWPRDWCRGLREADWKACRK